MNQRKFNILFFILGWSQNLVLGLIEGDIRWPTRLLSEDSQLTLTIRGDGRVFRRPKVELLRNKHIIHKEDFFLSKDLPARIEFHFGCDLFKAKGLYEARVIGTPGTPPVYSNKKLLDKFPDFSLSFSEDEVQSLSREVMVVGMFNQRRMCHQSDRLVTVSVEKLDNRQWDEAYPAIYVKFPSDALTIPCQAFNLPGQYRLTTKMDETVISRSKPIQVISENQYSLTLELDMINDNRFELKQCKTAGDYFDVKYISPPCAQGHKLKLVPLHKSPAFQIKHKIYDISSRSMSIRLPCSDIHQSAHGACIYYENEFGQVQATKCFAIGDKPTPDVDGNWSPWEGKLECSAPCSLNGLADETYPIDQSSTALSNWSFRTRQCSNPSTMGQGQTCQTKSQTTLGSWEFDVDQNSCRNPWQLSRSIIQTENESCECGCKKTIGSNVAAIFSPAPWRCPPKNGQDEIKWEFECDDCDSIFLHVLHFDLDPSEKLFIHEDDTKVYKISELGSTQHQTRKVTIRYVRGEMPGCGFGLRLSFQRVLFIPTQASPRSEILDENNLEDNTAANLGLWGILVCSGFLMLLVVASIFNCRSTSGGNPELTVTEKPNSSTQDTEIIMDDSFNRSINRSPQKIKPNAACYSLAQHQLRMMKQDGTVSAVACYPRELVENECQVKEQIPLLFGDMATMNTMGKQISGVSMSSDQIEAAPANSNRTETTHSTTVSDQSNNFKRHSLYRKSTNRETTGVQRPYSMGYADNESSTPSSLKFQPPNSRVQSDEDNQILY